MTNSLTIQSQKIEITWKEYRSYDDAKDQYKIIYMVVMNGNPAYIGMCNLSVFGGVRREIEGRMCNPRYGLGYKHWINVALANGSKLFIGKIENASEHLLVPIEKTLILKYLPEHNKLKVKVLKKITLRHSGEFPDLLNY